MKKFKNPSHLWATLLIDQFVKSGVTNFFCCPGMRNAPLLKAIALHPEARAFSGHDERAHSYRAIGFMKGSGKPAALVCTSGTAVANFLPAIIEAQKTHLPLFVISADRPSELNATDANQTINQTEVLRGYTKAFWDGSAPFDGFPLRAFCGSVCFNIATGLKSPRGPVHLNIPFREPLDHSPKELSESWCEEANTLINLPVPSLHVARTETHIADSVINDLFARLQTAKKPLLIFGPLGAYDQYDKKMISDFLSFYKGLFFFDVTTGLKFLSGTDDGLVPSLDHPEVLHTLEERAPDIVIHLGHRLTSKHYYGLLSRLSNTSLIHVSEGTFHEDPGFSFTDRWMIKPHQLLKAFVAKYAENKEAKKDDHYKPPIDWEPLIKRKRTVIESNQLTYPFITKRAIDTLTFPMKVFIGNSTFIRSFDSYAGTYASESPWHVIANRGASGIEGHIAMARGMMIDGDKACPGAAFLGDISFIHDLNSLVGLGSENPPLLLVVANNKKGGIFNLLPISEDPEGQKYHSLMTTPHDLAIGSLLESMNLPVKTITTKESYQEALDLWKKNPQLLILNVEFKDEDNIEVYKTLKTLKL